MMARDSACLVIDAPDDLLEAGAHRLQNNRIKRCLDVAGAGFGLLFLSPFLLLVALVIVLESHGPVFFRQRRSGLNGAPFTIYKFRTMRVLEDGPDVVQAQRDDCRTTRVGAFMRRTSIDELPNLINVLKNEMSLVGPRPHALAHDAYFGAMIPGYTDRYRTKPGLTGLAQVAGLRGRTDGIADMAARVDLDVEYIRQWSPVLDVQLLLRTVAMGPNHPAAY
jgi:putative colanic acid biosynthesis UDP-glucose lipid carrier transferase